MSALDLISTKEMLDAITKDPDKTEEILEKFKKDPSLEKAFRQNVEKIVMSSSAPSGHSDAAMSSTLS